MATCKCGGKTINTKKFPVHAAPAKKAAAKKAPPVHQVGKSDSRRASALSKAATAKAKKAAGKGCRCSG